MFREMRRKKQQLDESACLDVLATAPRGVLAVCGDDGYPYTVPVSFVFADGALYFHGAKAGHKVDAMLRSDKVSFNCIDEPTFEPGDYAPYFRSVVLFGRLSVVEDEEAAAKYAMALADKFYPRHHDEYADELARKQPAMHVFKLTVEHMSGKRVHEQ